MKRDVPGDIGSRDTAGSLEPYTRDRRGALGWARAAAPVGVFSRGTTRISGSLSCGAREVMEGMREDVPCAWSPMQVPTGSPEQWPGASVVLKGAISAPECRAW